MGVLWTRGRLTVVPWSVGRSHGAPGPLLSPCPGSPLPARAETAAVPQPLPAPPPAPLTSPLQLQWESCNVSVLFKENPRLKGFDVRVLGKVLICPVLPTPGKQGGRSRWCLPVGGLSRLLGPPVLGRARRAPISQNTGPRPRRMAPNPCRPCCFPRPQPPDPAVPVCGWQCSFLIWSQIPPRSLGGPASEPGVTEVRLWGGRWGRVQRTVVGRGCGRHRAHSASPSTRVRSGAAGTRGGRGRGRWQGPRRALTTCSGGPGSAGLGDNG